MLHSYKGTKKTRYDLAVIAFLVALLVAFAHPGWSANAFDEGPWQVAGLKIGGSKPKAPEPAAEEPAEEPAEETAEETAAEEAAAEETAAEETAAEEAAAEKTAAEEDEKELAEDETIEGIEEEEILVGGTTYEQPAAASGKLLVESNPPGAKVFIDGEELGVTPLQVEGLSDAPHEVILYSADKGAHSQMVETGWGRVFVDLQGDSGMGVGFVFIETDPPDARIDIDSKRMGLTPMKLPLVTGRHTVVLTREGYGAEEISVTVEEGQTVEVRRKLKQNDGAILIITSPAGAEILLDGVSMGTASEPMRISQVAPGMHEVRVTKAGYEVWERKNVMIEPDKTETILASLQPESGESNVRIYTEPEGARVWLDGKEVGVAGPDGLGLFTNKGAHILRLELNPMITPGYRPLQTSISFTEDIVDYSENPIKLPVIDEAFITAERLYNSGQGEEAISYLDRVSPSQTTYAESRVMMIEILADLNRHSEIPGEFEKLFSDPSYQRNPVLNLAMGYWAIQAARKSSSKDSAGYLSQGIVALERCAEAVDYFPAQDQQVMALKAHYYTGIASELLFGLTGEKKYVKKGVQAWELFFARLSASEETLGDEWIKKARKHQKNLQYLEKKLGG